MWDFTVLGSLLIVVIVGGVISSLFVSFVLIPPSIARKWFRRRSQKLKLWTRAILLLIGASGFALLGYWSLGPVTP